MDVWTLLIAGIALWFGFQWGKHYRRDKEEKAEQLLGQAEQEIDPEKKTKLLLEWYGLTANRRSKMTFKEHFLGRKKKERRR